MTQEDKELLLKDLCARLPYGIKVFYKYKTWLSEKFATSIRLADGKIALSSKFDKEGDWFPIEEAGEILIKPYLRPIRSLTSMECDKLFEILNINEKDEWLKINNINILRLFTKSGKDFYEIAEAMDYLYSIHVDFRDMIENDLAIEVTDENNPYKS